ncbi:MAG: hypothetical protein R3E83_24810 [Burkholderiaceae bacterium]
MSSLGISLLILVIVGVGGVAFYNLWLMRGHSRSLTNLLIDELDAPDARGRRAEPSLTGDDDHREALTVQREPRRWFDSSVGDGRNEPSMIDAPAPAQWTDRALNGSDTRSHEEPGIGPDSLPPGLSEAQATAGAALAATDAEEDLAAHIPAGMASPVHAAVDEPAPWREPDTDVGDNDHADMHGPSRADEPVPSAVPDSFDTTPAAEMTAPEAREPVGESASLPRAAIRDEAYAEHGPAQSPPRDEPAPEDAFHLNLLVEFDKPVPGARLSRWTRDLHRVGSKPVDVLARHVFSDGTRSYDTIRESMPYDALLLRLLLVNRQGPLNAMEFSEFASHVQRLGEEFEVLIDAPDMNQVLGRARALDDQIGPLDAQIAVNVEVPSALSPDEFSRISERLGLHQQTSQRYVRLDQHDEPLFSAALTEAAGRILLLLDVPRANGDGQPLREVVETAWKYAQAFEGRMVDDAGQPIDNALFDRIEHQLDTLYHSLDAQGLHAGSPLARRVFNL